MSGQTPAKDNTVTTKMGTKADEAKKADDAKTGTDKKSSKKKEGFELRESGGVFQCIDLSNETCIASGGDEEEIKNFVDARNYELEHKDDNKGEPDGREEDGSNNAQRLPAGGDVDSTLGAPADGDVSSSRAGG